LQELVDDFMDVPVSVASVGPMVRVQEDPLGGVTPGTGAVVPGGGTPTPLPVVSVPQPSQSPPPLASLALGDDGYISDSAAYMVLPGLLAVVLAWVLWVMYDQARRLSSKEKGARHRRRCPNHPRSSHRMPIKQRRWCLGATCIHPHQGGVDVLVNVSRRTLGIMGEACTC
jgi:hypothetical protein